MFKGISKELVKTISIIWSTTFWISLSIKIHFPIWMIGTFTLKISEWPRQLKQSKVIKLAIQKAKNQCIKALNAFLKIMNRKNKIDRVTKCTQFARHLENSKNAEEVISETDTLKYITSSWQISTVALLNYFWFSLTGLRISEGIGVVG